MANNLTTDYAAASAAAAEKHAQRTKDVNEKATTTVEARAAAQEKQATEYYERMVDCQPTPTQRENDLFRMGIHEAAEDKEDDGSEYQDDHTRRILEAKLPGMNPYETRMEGEEGGAGTYPEGAEQPPRRGPGRPRKEPV